MASIKRSPSIIVTSTDFFFGFKSDLFVITKIKKYMFVYFTQLVKEVQVMMDNGDQMPKISVSRK